MKLLKLIKTLTLKNISGTIERYFIKDRIKSAISRKNPQNSTFGLNPSTDNFLYKKNPQIVDKSMNLTTQRLAFLVSLLSVARPTTKIIMVMLLLRLFTDVALQIFIKWPF